MANLFNRNGIWYIQFKDMDGKWKLRTCGKNAKKSDAEYLKKLYTSKELNRFHKAPVRIIESGLIEALETFRDKILLRGVNGDKEWSSIRRERAEVNNFIAFFKSKGIRNFTEANEEAIRQFMDKRRDEDKMSPSTRWEERRLLNKFFRHAIENNYCVENPAEDIPVPKIERGKPRYFSEEELANIFAAAREPYRDIFRFLYLTGLRIGELANLEWKDYNKAQAQLTIRVMSGNKTKREETVPLNKSAIGLLERRKIAKTECSHIFLNAEGLPLDNDNIYRNLMRLLKSLKIEDASPHTFRHTTASHLVIKGVPIYTVKEILRHKSVTETEIYAHLSNMAVKNAIGFLQA